jgi:hypothetical protein
MQVRCKDGEIMGGFYTDENRKPLETHVDLSSLFLAGEKEEISRRVRCSPKDDKVEPLLEVPCGERGIDR